MRSRPQPTAALRDMLAADGTLDEILDGRGLRFERAPAAPAPQPGPSIRELIEPPDWEQEERDRLAVARERERQQRTRIIEEELSRIQPVDTGAPSKPRPRARAWLDERLGREAS